jgi:hypothetical protein
MKPVNILLSLLSLNALVVIIERLSPTTRIFLQPYDFLRLHEVFQMLVVIAASVVISYFLLKVISDNFRLLAGTGGTIAGILFILGTYFMATGNGAHEIASHLFHTFCNTRNIETAACGSMYVNDYYFGNIVYFFGLLMGNIGLIFLERKNPVRNFSIHDIWVTIANGIIYALTLFAYAAFDPVLVGLGFIIIAALAVDALLLSARAKPTLLPFTLYCAVAYTLSAVATILVKFR